MGIITNSLENIKNNKLRVFVAIIWIILGITSIVVVSSIGEGIENQSKFANLNPKFRTFIISFNPSYENQFKSSFFEAFSNNDIDLIKSMRGIERVIPKYGDNIGNKKGLMISTSKDETSSEFKCVNEKNKLKVDFGREFSLDDLDRKTVVLEESLVYTLFDESPRRVIGKSIIIEGDYFEVIGIIKSNLAISNNNPGEYFKQPKCYIPYKAKEEMDKKNSFGGSIKGVEILVSKEFDIDKVSFDVIGKLQNYKKEELGDIGEYIVLDKDDGGNELKFLKGQINTFTNVLSNISLIIGGIGIMNIMYMSVSERQREIGIRRAIGAQPRDILLQFLIETVVITILGGGLGIIIGTLVSIKVGSYFGMQLNTSIHIFIKSICISIFLGVVFGSIPAIKASRLDPIKAIQG